ncbi:MAG: cupin domain-containing protein [bacterium]|nr:cupin domain-containing protein [bacterium]
MFDKVDIAGCFERFSDTFSPKVVGELNGQIVAVVRCEGDKVPWHVHDGEDEMFYVLDGALDVLRRDATVTLEAGQFCIVPRGVEHRVLPRGHVKLMLFEPAGIAHTGDVESEITLKEFDRLDPS